MSFSREAEGLPAYAMVEAAGIEPAGHSNSDAVAVNVETEQKVSVTRARDLFANFPGLRLWDDPTLNRYPMPVLLEGQDDCFVGRIREDLSLPNALNFWVVGDQLRKGAATNAVQIAELLIR